MVIIVRKASTYFGRISLTDSKGKKLLLSEDEKLIFTVKKKLDSSDIIINKIIHEYDQINETYPFVLNASETDLPTGRYFYDVGLSCKNGEFYHITAPDEFIINGSLARGE